MYYASIIATYCRIQVGSQIRSSGCGEKGSLWIRGFFHVAGIGLEA